MPANRLMLSEAKDVQEEGLEVARQSVPITERDDVPEHAADVKSWVGTDPERAQRALDQENERGRPREGLVAHLESVIGG